jgi:hypothetical protein
LTKAENIFILISLLIQYIQNTCRLKAKEPISSASLKNNETQVILYPDKKGVPRRGTNQKASDIQSTGYTPMIGKPGQPAVKIKMEINITNLHRQIPAGKN